MGPKIPKYKLLFQCILFFTISCSFASEKSLVLDNFDFVLQIYPAKTLKIEKISEILQRNPEFVTLSSHLELYGHPLPNSINKITVSGNYYKESGVILNTTIPESILTNVLKNKYVETYRFGQQTIHQYVKRNKPIYTSYLQPRLLMISDNLTIIKEARLVDINEVLNKKYNISENKNRIGSCFLRNLSKLKINNKAQGKNNSVLRIQNFEEAIILASSDDNKIIEISAIILCNPKTEQSVKFQINTLFLIFLAYMSQENPKLTAQLTNSFKIENLKPGQLCVTFSFDSELLQNIPFVLDKLLFLEATPS